MNTVFFLLGANLGDPLWQLNAALAEIRTRIGRVDKVSGIYETAAWGVKNQPAFLNQALEGSTVLDAFAILDIALAIENELGRTRTKKWTARTIDIDLMYFNAETIASARLTVPHPHIQDRRFALAPLCEIAPDFIHPIWKKTHRTMLAECPDDLPVRLRRI